VGVVTGGGVGVVGTHCPGQKPVGGHTVEGVQVEPGPQGVLVAPISHGVGVGVTTTGMHCPPQPPVGGHVIVGVQVQPGLQRAPVTPISHGRTGVPVEMQAPPQRPVGGHTIVGVHIEPGPQTLHVAPISHGVRGGGVMTGAHNPPQTSVCVQNDPVGHGEPPRMQEAKVGVPVPVVWQRPVEALMVRGWQVDPGGQAVGMPTSQPTG
jgi:hypothetical protein